MRFGRHAVRRHATGPLIDISEKNGVRSMYMNSDTVQSSMLLADPSRLVLSYTRAMMSFLLFKPAPRDVWLIGLGGASIPRFIHRHLPTTRCRVIELHEQVLALAQSMFGLPDLDSRLQVIIDDGADYVMRHEDQCEVLLVDGFDGVQIATELCTPAFFHNCARALKQDGIFAMNLWGSDKAFNRHVSNISTAFDSRVLLLPARQKGNVIALGFKASLGEPKWETLRERGKKLQELFGLEFLDFISDLAAMNLCTDKRLLI